MSIPTKLGWFLLLLLVQYTCTTFSARYFELDVLICQRKCRADQRKDLAQCDKDCLQPLIDWIEEEKSREEENIFVFHIQTVWIVEEENGYICLFQRFDTRSDVLQGLRNYRLVEFRANPGTFLSPSHRNVDSIGVVIRGGASITLIHQGNKETHNVKLGDIIRIRAGTIVHYVNPDDDLQLFAMLELTVNSPDYFESFFAAGSTNHQSYFNETSTANNQESFYSAFSDEVLQAAFNTDKDEARKLVRGRSDCVFIKVSQEQIKALLSEQNSSKSGNQPFSTPYNIFNKDPSYSNIYGKLYEINPHDYQQIQDLDIQLTYANITKGAMFGPFHNTRSTTIAMVRGGSGYFQIACPHLSQQQGASYNASAKLLSGDVFVVPAGHPVVIVASGDMNLEVLYFEINARDNQRIPLAGMNNVLKQLSNEAKQLSFNMSSEQVDDILDKQKESWFFPGPGQQNDLASV